MPSFGIENLASAERRRTVPLTVATISTGVPGGRDSDAGVWTQQPDLLMLMILPRNSDDHFGVSGGVKAFFLSPGLNLGRAGFGGFGELWSDAADRPSLGHTVPPASSHPLSDPNSARQRFFLGYRRQCGLGLGRRKEVTGAGEYVCSRAVGRANSGV